MGGTNFKFLFCLGTSVTSDVSLVQKSQSQKKSLNILLLSFTLFIQLNRTCKNVNNVPTAVHWHCVVCAICGPVWTLNFRDCKWNLNEALQRRGPFL